MSLTVIALIDYYGRQGKCSVFVVDKEIPDESLDQSRQM